MQDQQKSNFDGKIEPAQEQYMYTETMALGPINHPKKAYQKQKQDEAQFFVIQFQKEIRQVVDQWEAEIKANRKRMLQH